MEQYLLYGLLALNVIIIGVLLFQMMSLKKTERYIDDTVMACYGADDMYSMTCPEFQPCRDKRKDAYFLCMEERERAKRDGNFYKIPSYKGCC